MTMTASTDELQRGYEALRDQAMGAMPRVTPRGLAVLLRGGLPAWMAACPPTSPSVGDAPTSSGGGHTLAGLSAELVQLLTEMVLESRRGCPP